MVKADCSRDYYADLELPPSCDKDEIKKQFKKLALKYHPDRNPGKELEFNAKFQAIQSAHEVLIDQQQRSKYDADRLRSAAFDSSVPPRRPDVPPRAAPTNFNTTTNFPPPPRRAPPPNFPKTPASGADRYSKYTPNEKPAWSTGKDDAQTRTNAYKAWQQMRHGTGSQREQRVPPPTNTTRPARPFSQYDRETNNEVPKAYAPGPRTTWEQFPETQVPPRAPRAGMSRSNTTRVPKKNGFAPATSGRDEPPARNTSAYFVSRGGRPQAPRADTQYPPPPGPPPTGKTSVPPTPDYLKSFQSPKSADSFASSDRLSTPYATAGGERTYFSSGNLGGNDLSRSASLRSNKASAGLSGRFSPNMKSPLSSGFSGRHRSASPNMRGRSSPQAYSTSSDSSSDDLSDESNYPSARRADVDHRPTAQRPRDEPRRSSHHHVRAEEDQSLHGNVTPSGRTSTRDANVSSETNNNLEQEANSQPSSRKASDAEGPEGFLKHRMRRDAERGNLPASPLRATTPPSFQNQRPLEKSRSWQEKYGSREDGNNQRKFEKPSEPDIQKDHPIFAHPVNNGNVPASPMRSPSADNINTKFSPSNWHGQFTGSGEHIWGTSPPKVQPQEPSNTKGNPQPSLPDRLTDHSRTSQMPPPAKMPIPAKVPGQAKFSHEEWEHHFKEPTFAFPPPPPPLPRIGTPKRSKAPRNASMNQKRPVVPKPASVSAAIYDSEEEKSLNVPGSVVESELSQSSGSGSAMDIDPIPTPPKPEIPLDGLTNTKSNSVHRSGGPSTTPHKTESPRMDSDSQHLNFGNLKKVAPLIPNASGLNDLEDLNSTLPFESRPSNHPIKPFTPRRLELPNPPKAPTALETVTQSSWEYYIAHMRAYMLEWTTFNTQMLAHFMTRQAEIEKQLEHDWMSAIGEGGYARYMRGVEEDFRVREHWDVSWEKHRDCMKGLGVMREKAAKGRLDVNV